MNEFKSFKSRAFLLLLALTLCGFVSAQKIQITGTVIDQTDIPVIGASILEKNTTNGTITDIDGLFSLSVSPDATLVISYMGYKTQEIAVQNNRQFNIKLQEDALLLEETVVIGYGVLKKSDMTGAISSVDTEDLARKITTNPAEALQGKVAGVNIQKSGGIAGASIQVKIRGVKTFGDNNPLYIIDGFPGDIDNVNPQDIASMEVLKDGAASAIYGSVAANGVIIITTKSGQKGDIKVDFSTYFTSTKVANKLKFLNAEEYKSVHKTMYDNFNEQFPNEAVTLPAYIEKNTGIDTNWQDIMQRDGLSKNYMVSVRGGTENAKYSISYNHADDRGIFLGNNFVQDNARAKLFMKKGIFDFDANLSLRYTKSEYPQYSLKEMYMMSPLVPVYNEEEEYGFGLTNFDGIPNNRNVMADHHYERETTRRYYTTANIGITVNFTDWLNFKTAYGYRAQHERIEYHAPDYIADEKSKRLYPYHSETYGYWEEQVLDNVLTFNKDFNKHHITAMAGNSITGTKYNWNSVGVEGKTTVYEVKDGKLVTNEMPAGFLDPSFSTIAAGEGGTFSGEGSKWDYRRVSFFGRLNYNYDNRYLLQATLRYDGSSKFGSDNRWGGFPSIALGWRISEEAFFPKHSAINNLRLRASWGRLGNENALGYYDFQALITTYNTKYQGYVKGNGENPWAGSIARELENRSLKWETTDTKNIGLDIGLFNNKLVGALNYYYNQTEDLLITKALPPSAGLNNPILNVGKIRNSGFELELDWNDRVNQFEYNIGFNLATISNKVTQLADAGQTLYGEGLKWGTEHFPTQTKEGKPIGSFYLYKTAGIFQSMDEVNAHVNEAGELLQPDARPGDIRFVDSNNDGTINDDDKEYSGSGIPKLEANINFSANYKGFDLSFTLGSAWGHKLYNGNKYFYEGMSSGSNFLRSSLNAWTPENRNTNVPRAIYQDPNLNMRESDRFLEKADFVRLRSIQLGYTLPKDILQKIYLEKLRVYFNIDNLFTITGYDGIDPEFSRSSVLNTGIDKFIYPFTRSFTIGAQLTF